MKKTTLEDTPRGGLYRCESFDSFPKLANTEIGEIVTFYQAKYKEKYRWHNKFFGR